MRPIRSAASAVLLIGLTSQLQGQEPVIETPEGHVRVVTVAGGLEQPWSLAFLPNGDLLITEKPGRLRIVREGRLLSDPVPGVPLVRYLREGGLLDVVPHPDFSANRLVYLSYAKPNEDGSLGTTAVGRGRLIEDRLQDFEEIFVADAWDERSGHYGSRLAFDADGYLYVTVGDREVMPSGAIEELLAHPAQDLSNHYGTVNRLHDDGRIPADNPFVGRPDVEPSIWSYGHRSPQGLAIHPTSGAILQSEHGPQGGDELNLILRGRNYGWPVIGFGENYGGAPLHPARERPDMEQPLQYFSPSPGVSSVMIYTGDRFPDWKNSVFIGGLAIPEIIRVPIVDREKGPRAGRVRTPILLGFARIRDIRQGPDGYIYLALEERPDLGNTRIVRLEPVRAEQN